MTDHDLGRQLAENLARHLDDAARAMLADIGNVEVPDPPTLAGLEEAARLIDDARLTLVCSPADAARLADLAGTVPFPPRTVTVEGLDPGTAYAIAPHRLRSPFDALDRRAELRRLARIDDR